MVLKWVGMAKGLVNLSSANPALWAMPGLNWRPLPCQGSALPLRQPPVAGETMPEPALLVQAGRNIVTEWKRFAIK